jgi:hypothetical protein
MARPDFKKNERVIVLPGGYRAGQIAQVMSVAPGALLPWSVRICFEDGEIFEAAPSALRRA